MEEQYQNFEGLRQELQTICGDNESLQDKLDEISNICRDLVESIKLNERAHLLTVYYQLCLRRGHALTRNDYQSLLSRLNPNTRKQFEMKGGFEAMDKNKDGQVDVNEFQDMINIVLEIAEEPETVAMKKLTQINYQK